MKKIITLILLACTLSLTFAETSSETKQKYVNASSKVNTLSKVQDNVNIKAEQIIIDYNILQDRNISDLEIQVKNLIKIGWVPLGGISVICLSYSYETFYYTQVMIKYQDTK